MRRSLISATIAFAVAVPVFAQDHGAGHENSHEQAHALLEQLEATRARLHELVSGLSSEQWNFKSAEDRWSIAEVVEHITLEVLSEGLSEKAVTDDGREAAGQFERQIAGTLSDRSQKFPAPPNLEPTGRWTGGDEVLAAFDEVRGGLMSFVHEADFDLRTRFAPNPILGADVDASGWTVIAIEHGKRHMDQIREVTEDAAFPTM